MRTYACALALGLLWPTGAQGQESGEWEPWSDSALAAAPVGAAAPREAAVDGTPDAQAPEIETAAREYFLHFGAGASFLMPVRPGDLAHDDRWLSEISFRWAPFGLTGEIGLDFALGRDNVILIRPNLKFFFVKGWSFSMFLDGGCSVLTHPGGTEVGGSASLGLVIGLHDNVAIELAGTVSMFGMTDQAAAAFVGGEPTSESGDPRLVIFPGATARLMARF